MSITTCQKGHIYNSDIFTSCPHCALIAAGGRPASDKEGRTIAFYNKNRHKKAPVAGWVVCIDGPDKGKDFRIIAGRNPIGRSETEEKFSITLTDLQISRSGTAAIINYDSEKNLFTFSAAVSASLLPYVDGEPALSETPLHPFSQIEIAESLLVFVPFCGESFIWQSEENNSYSGTAEIPAVKSGSPAERTATTDEEGKPIMDNTNGITLSESKEE